MTLLEQRVANFIGGASLLEWFFGVTTMGLGIVLLWPGDTFLNPFYAELARVLREEQWGWFMLGWGLIRCVALLATHLYRWAHVLRAACAMFGIGVFTAIAVAFAAARSEASAAATIGMEGLQRVADAYRQTSLGAADPQMIEAVKHLAVSVEGLARAQFERAERDPKRLKQFEEIIDEIRQARRSIEDLAAALDKSR